jgi:hypothetical protein
MPSIPSRSVLGAAVLAALSLLAAPAAHARDPLAGQDFQESGAPRPSGPTAEPTPAYFVLQAAADFGQTTAVKLLMSDGSTKTLRYNQGVSAAAGIMAVPLLEGRLMTQATIGVEYSALSASNQDVRWLAFPLEVMEVANLMPIRLGAGISCLLAPSLKAKGDLLSGEVKFKTSVGFLGEAGLTFRNEQNPRKPLWWITVRYEAQRIQAESGGPTDDASAFGVVLGGAL